MQGSSSNLYWAPKSEYTKTPYLDQLERVEISDCVEEKDSYTCKLTILNQKSSDSIVNNIVINYLLKAVDPEKLVNNSSIPSYTGSTCSPADKKTADLMIQNLLTDTLIK